MNAGRTAQHKHYEKTGMNGKSKNEGNRKKGVGNNSNKLWDFKDLIADDSD